MQFLTCSQITLARILRLSIGLFSFENNSISAIPTRTHIRARVINNQKFRNQRHKVTLTHVRRGRSNASGGSCRCECNMQIDESELGTGAGANSARSRIFLMTTQMLRARSHASCICVMYAVGSAAGDRFPISTLPCNRGTSSPTPCLCLLVFFGFII